MLIPNALLHQTSNHKARDTRTYNEITGDTHSTPLSIPNTINVSQSLLAIYRKRDSLETHLSCARHSECEEPVGFVFFQVPLPKRRLTLASSSRNCVTQQGREMISSESLPCVVMLCVIGSLSSRLL